MNEQDIPETVIPEAFLTFEEKVAHIASYDYKTQRSEWDEAVADVLHMFMDTEKKLTEATERLKNYEVGFNFADKLPDVGEKIIFEWWDGNLGMRIFDGKSGNNIKVHDEYYNESVYDITKGRFTYRWRTLPLPKYSLENVKIEITDYVVGKGGNTNG